MLGFGWSLAILVCDMVVRVVRIIVLRKGKSGNEENDGKSLPEGEHPEMGIREDLE